MGRKAAGLSGLFLVALVVVATTVDWRFWYRWHTLPDDPGEWPASYYQPVFELAGDPQEFYPGSI